jgi:glucoamylase
MKAKAKPPHSAEPKRDANASAIAVNMETVLYARPSAWVNRHRTTSERRLAPGAPGSESHWTTAAKDGVGTALNESIGSTSLVWFTIEGGRLTEIFYPRVDRACTRDLRFVVTDGDQFFSDELTDAEHSLEMPVDGVPLYHLVNRCRQGKYRLAKTIFSHPDQDAVIQITRFEPLNGSPEALRLFVLVAPHLGNMAKGNTAWLGDHNGVPGLFAQRGTHCLALLSSAPWVAGSAGFAGVSDGLSDLQRHKRLTGEYDRAEDGNVVLTGEVDLKACGGTFALAVGFGTDPAEAGHRAVSSLADDLGRVQADYVNGWERWQQRLSAPKQAGGRGGRNFFRLSASVLRAHGDGSIPGAMIASLSTPWGEARGDGDKALGTGGYHLVWPRDLVESAGGLLAAGARSDAERVLAYLRAIQHGDGHWPQNLWVSSAHHGEGIQLGETALPVLLFGLLRRNDVLTAERSAAYWPMIKRAATYLVRSGPSTQEDRWENQRGYTPYTLATVISAFLVAAELAEEQNEPTVGSYLCEIADAWNTAIESWLYVTDTELARRIGVEGYYVRTIPPELDDRPAPRLGHVRLKDPDAAKNGIRFTEIVSPDALALVRFGLRRPDDPRIVSTVKVIDALLKAETPRGPAWRRYNGDGYGEKPDGSPYMSRSDAGLGRAWPLLTGERAHYELAAGRRDEARRLARAMETLAGDGGMIPEQVWDSDDIPERGLFRGRPAGSAMPLAWAHAEYLKLVRSIDNGQLFDMPPQTVQRYIRDAIVAKHVIWRFNHPTEQIMPGDILRVETLAPARVLWTHDNWTSRHEVRTRDTGLGLHVSDLPTQRLKRGTAIVFTFFWPECDRWEGKDFAVRVI